MSKYISFILTLFALAANAHAQTIQHIVVKLVDATGTPITTGQVAAILKSGAYQEAKLDVASGEYKCDPTIQCIKVFAAAKGCEAAVTKYPGSGGTVIIAMKPSATKNSTIIYRRGPLPGIEGDVNPIYDNLKRLYLFATKIGLEKNGRPAQQPITFSLNRPINAISSIGKPFKIWVVDITQEVSIIEYTLPQ